MADSRPGCAEHTLFETEMFKIFTYFRPGRIKRHTLHSSEAIISVHWIKTVIQCKHNILDYV